MSWDEERKLQGPADRDDNLLVLPPKRKDNDPSPPGDNGSGPKDQKAETPPPPNPPRTPPKHEPGPPRQPPNDPQAPGGKRRATLPVTSILVLATIAAAGLTISAAAIFAVYRVPLSVQIVVPIVVMATLYGMAYVFVYRGWIIAGQTALNTGLLVFGLAVYTIGSTLRVVNHWPDLLFIWAVGALSVAALMPSKSALTQAFFVSSAWSTAETIYFGVPLHGHFLAFWAIAFGLTSGLNWLPGLYVALGTLAVWLALNSLSALSELYWGEIHVASLHVLLWLGLWVISRLLATFEFDFARTLARASLAVVLAALGYLMTTYAVPEDFQFLWFVTAAIGAALVLIFSAIALARTGTRSGGAFDPVVVRAGLRPPDLPVVMSITVFAVGYPLFYDTLYQLVGYEDRVLALFTGALFCAWCLWVVLLGRRERDGMVIGIGLIAAAVEILMITMEFLGGRADSIVILSVGISVLIALFITLTWIRSRGGNSAYWGGDRTPPTDV